MFNLKINIKNNHTTAKKNKFWFLICFVVLSMLFITAKSNAIGQLYNITLPQRVTGVEKLEYTVDGSPQGSTDGKTYVQLPTNSGLYFSVKIAPTGYSQLLAKNVTIVSNKGTTLSLRVVTDTTNGKFETRSVNGDELINPDTTYVTAVIAVNRNESFTIQGLTLDKFKTTVTLSDTSINIGEALDVTYSEVGGNTASATVNSDDNSYVIPNITMNNSVKVWIKTQAAYSQSEIAFTIGGLSINPSDIDSSLSIPAITEEKSIVVSNLTKNQYDLSFSSSGYTDNPFEYKKSDSQGAYTGATSESITVTHGDSYYFKCTLTSENPLVDKEVTVNTVAVRAIDEVYSLNNISEDTTVAITNATDSYYKITLPSSSVGATITDTSGNALRSPTVLRSENFNFKVSPTAAYDQNIGFARIYAVPTSKLVNGDYDTTVNPTESDSYLLNSSADGIFTILSVQEPKTIIIKNLIINKYHITLPSTVTGASYAVTPSDYVTQVTGNQFAVIHGKSVEITLTAAVGKSIAEAALESGTNPSIQISRSGNVFTLENITKNTDIIIDNITDATYEVTFQGTGIFCTNENGTAFTNNKTSITHAEGVVRFKIEPTEGYEIISDSIIVKADNATVDPPSGGTDYYTLSNATGNTVVEVTGASIKSLTVSLAASYNSNVEFASISSNYIILPESNPVNYGSDFDFKLIPSLNWWYFPGIDISDISLNTSDGSEITSLGNNRYRLSNVLRDVTIVAVSPSEIPKITDAPSYWKIAQNVELVSKPSGACEINYTNTPPLSHSYIPVTYSLSDELSYNFTQSYNYPYTGEGFNNSTDYKFYYDSDLTHEITNGMYSPDGNYQIFISYNFNYNPHTATRSLTVNISVAKTSTNKTEDYFHRYNYSALDGGVDTESSTLSIFNTIYIAAELEEITDFTNTTNISFYLPPKGAKYYQASLPFIGSNYVQRGAELTDLTYTLDRDSEFLFIVGLDEGYQMSDDAVKVRPDNKITFTQLENVWPSENRYCYKLEKSYTPDVQVYIEDTQIKNYTANFSGEGTNFLDGKGDQFLNKTFNHGDTFTFTTEAKEGYVDEGLTFKLTTANGEYTNPTTENAIMDAAVQLDVNYNTENKKTSYTLSKIKGDFSIKVTRKRKTFNVYFQTTEGIKYMIPSSNMQITGTQLVEYQRNFSFIIEAQEGYDISNMAVTANHGILDFINGKYTIRGIIEDNTVRVEDVSKISKKVTFTQYEGLAFKDIGGNTFSTEKQVNYGDDIEFKAVLSEAYSNSAITLHAEYPSGNTEKFEPVTGNPSSTDNPYLNTTTGVYKINVKENVRIYAEGMNLNKYNVKFAKTSGISYYNQYGTDALQYPPESGSDDFITQPVTYGNSLSFKVLANEGYDISNLEVFSKKANVNSARAQMFPSNGVYTLENITEEYTITTEKVTKSTCQIEFRVVEGGRCINEYGNEIGNTVTVTYGTDYSFRVSLDNAYNNSSPTVTVKGTDNFISPNADKSYTISNVTSNKIIEIINITKNSYVATFKATEGVVYKTAKNKPFTGTQNVEYGDTLYFKVSLLDAYDKSYPWVLLNGEKTLVENGGVYSLENIRDNVEVIVKNVIKNPEEVTMDDINKVPNEITSQDDVDAVVTATQTYNQLTDEEKSGVLSITNLESAQQKAGEINHKSEDISISGVGWNIKVAVTNLSSDTTKMADFSSKVDRRSVLSLYEISLLDILTNTPYEVPYGTKVTVTLPIPELTGYKNTIIAHENSAGGMEYLDVNIADGTGQFETSSFSLFGVAAKEIPNYVENPSAMAISVSSLVDNTEELQTLLGEGLVSQLGNLINESTDDGTSTSTTSNTPGISGNTSARTSTTTNQAESESTSSLLSSVSNGISSGVNEVQNNLGKAYDWALDNELWAVVIILVTGSTLIGIIILISRKQNKES